MKKQVSIFFFLILSLGALGQQKNTYAEIGGGVGASSGSVGLAIHKNWTLGKNHKFVIGTGVRLTSFFGKNITFISAPPALTADPKSIDSLLAPKPSLSSLNAMINLGYRLNQKLEVGFNIDAIGISFGANASPNYITNGKAQATTAKPSAVNILLVGDNDKGSLNSHFHGKYELSKKIGVKLAYQFLFNELTTITAVQKVPSANDRFRVKSSMVFVGLNFNF
jgi:long-subunit fatty acid transport protein